MVNLPTPGDRVHIWPAPGLQVQDGALSVSDGGRWLPAEGRDVRWTPFHYEQIRAGEIYLHDPTPGEAAPAKHSRKEK